MTNLGKHPVRIVVSTQDGNIQSDSVQKLVVYKNATGGMYSNTYGRSEVKLEDGRYTVRRNIRRVQPD